MGNGGNKGKFRKVKSKSERKKEGGDKGTRKGEPRTKDGPKVVFLTTNTKKKNEGRIEKKCSRWAKPPGETTRGLNSGETLVKESPINSGGKKGGRVGGSVHLSAFQEQSDVVIKHAGRTGGEKRKKRARQLGGGASDHRAAPHL